MSIKKHLFSILIFIVYTSIFAQDSTPSFAKLSPKTQLLLATPEQAIRQRIGQDYVYHTIAGKTYLSGLIKMNTIQTPAAFEALGVNVGTKAGNIWTVQIPMENIKAFTQLNMIDYIELDEPISMNLDSVVRTTRADSVHAGINIVMPFTGKDVVVGVVDIGFDYTHPTLYDSLGNTYRVKRVWEQRKSGTPPTAYGYGNEIIDSLSMFAAQTDNSTNTHGMHVVGITSGSGRKSNATSNHKFQGMAFESDIVFVGITPDSTEWKNTGVSSIVDGINYVYQYAATVGKPAVVNLSWGPPLGPKDGTSLFSQAVDALTGAGKIFVCSAGNNGDVNLHINKSFTSTDTTVSTFVGFASYLNTKNTWVDVWGQSGQSFCAKVSLYNGVETATTGFVCLDNQLHRFYLIGANNDTCFVDMVTATSEFNGKPRLYLSLGSRVKDSICLTINGTSGTINIWNGYVRASNGYYGELTSNGRSWATAGDNNQTTSDFVATQSAISVGAYSSRINFKNISNSNQSYSGYTSLKKLVPFSSHGPTADNRIVPDITAPGLAVISSVSSFNADYKPGGADYSSVISRGYDSLNSKYYYYAQMSGTSMSSPAASGIVALMLQANPKLSPAEVKLILAKTAFTDTFTGTLPAQGNNLWGHGKINAYAAVMEAYTYPAHLNTLKNKAFKAELYPNPNQGKFTINISEGKALKMTLSIYDYTGKQVHQATWNKATGADSKNIDVNALSRGLYFVQLQSGTDLWVDKIVVE
jgi:minor extracellular serine protease Vpr